MPHLLDQKARRRAKQHDQHVVQAGEQAQGQGVGAGRDLGADDRLFRVKQTGKQLFQRVSADIVISVAGGGGKWRRAI